MKLISLFFILFAFSTNFKAQGLECYICDDCDNVDNLELKYCGPPDDSTPVPTTEPPTTTTTNQDTSTSTPVGSSTITPEEPPISTPPNTTDDPSTSTPAVSTETPETSSAATQPTSAPTTETTVTPSTVTTISSLPTTISTTTEAPTTLIEDASLEDSSETDEVLNKIVSPVARSSAAAILIRNYRSIANGKRETDSVYKCYKVKYIDDDGNTKIQRGCIAVPGDDADCETIKENAKDQKIEECRLCKEDGCNGSSTLKLSILTLFAVIILKCFV